MRGLVDDARFTPMPPRDFWGRHRAAKQRKERRLGAGPHLTQTRPARSQQDEGHEAGVVTSRTPSTWPHAPAGQPRHIFEPRDFQTMFQSPQQIETWFNHFPVLKQRNFYIVQKHYATAKHFDLRLQLDGATVSWAIPRGMANWEESERNRYAVETNPHPINYSLFEGLSSGTTACWDIGYYIIVKRQHRAGPNLTDDDTSDEDGGSGLSDTRTQDQVQEDLFAEAYHRVAFRGLPPRWGRPGRAAPADSGSFRQFIVELHGHRFKGLRLRFSRPARFVQLAMPKKSRSGDPARTRRTYFVALDPRTGDKGSENKAVPQTSILTGRTMEQIKAAGRLEAVLPTNLLASFRESWHSSDDSDYDDELLNEVADPGFRSGTP
ncbi:hypothetical protein OIO90_001600 [Microbotryomycetes sp. JL221]|nr:hypothetical protein OIO90_001600 [Microbotryomycetes sp. JL221]